jgi:hypothetical protein
MHNIINNPLVFTFGGWFNFYLPTNKMLTTPYGD